MAKTQIKLITSAKLKKELSNCDSSELIEIITELSAAFPQVREFFTVKFGDMPDSVILEKYKAEMTKEFFPARGCGKARASVAKKSITALKRVTSKRELIIDITLYYVELCVKYTAEYGDIDEPFYNSAVSTFYKVIDQINECHEQMFLIFKKRLESAVTRACDGWGFKDCMTEAYSTLNWI